MRPRGQEPLASSLEGVCPRFVADAMVGKLARWLRILGADVLYDPSLQDHQLLSLARREKRILLTRDAPLASRASNPPTLFIKSIDFRRQLVQVVETYRLDPRQNLFSRCIDCNALLEPARREEVRGKVPPYVYSTQARFKHCPCCDKYLWGGTHRHHMQQTLQSLFP
ncbi:MAG: Mut7-C RNAse domain-containing protein [Acidobacteriota bacterium]